MGYEKGNKIFLSDNVDETGSLDWYVKDAWYGKKSPHNTRESTVQIRDCYKQIELDFSYDSYEEYTDRLKKIDTLINELISFRTALRDSWGKK